MVIYYSMLFIWSPNDSHKNWFQWCTLINSALLNNLYITKYLSFLGEVSLFSFCLLFIRPPFPPKYINSIHSWLSFSWFLKNTVIHREKVLILELDICMGLNPRCATYCLCGQTSWALLPQTSSCVRIREWNACGAFSTVPGT